MNLSILVLLLQLDAIDFGKGIGLDMHSLWVKNSKVSELAFLWVNQLLLLPHAFVLVAVDLILLLFLFFLLDFIKLVIIAVAWLEVSALFDLLFVLDESVVDLF